MIDETLGDDSSVKRRRALVRQAINETLGDGASQAQMLGTPVVSFLAGQATKRHVMADALGKAASTGVPIDELRGIARAKAALAVVGGGAKSIGGGGIEGGMRYLRSNAIAIEVAVYGISGALVVGRIALRYNELVKFARIEDADAAEAGLGGAVEEGETSSSM